MSKKHRWLFISLLSACLLSGCAGPVKTLTPAATPVLPTATAIPSPTPAGPEVVITHPELEVISPENIDRLEQIDSWGEGKIYDYAVSPDKSMIAVSTARTVFILDSSDLKIVQAITRNEFPDSVQGNPVVFSPDGKLLVYATNNSIFQVELSTGENRYMGVSVLDQLSVRSIYISPDNSTIALVSYGGYNACDGAGGNISVYGPSIYLGSPYFTDFYCHPAMPMVRYTNTGLGYIFFENAFDYDIPILDIKKQMVSKMISSDEISPYGKIENISPDGKSFAVSLNEDGQWKVQIVDSRTYKTTQVLNGRMNEVRYSDKTGNWQVNPHDTAFDSCGLDMQVNRVQEIFRVDDQASSALVVSSANKFQIWNTEECMVENEFDPENANSLKVSPDNKLMAVSDQDRILLRNLSSGEVLFKFSFGEIPDEDPLIAYDFSPDGMYLVAGLYSKVDDGPNSIVDEKHAVSVWDLQTGQQVNLFRQSGSPLVAVDASSGNGIIVLRTREGVEVWNCLQGNLLYTLPTGLLLQSNNDEILLMDQSSGVYRYTPSSGLAEQLTDLPNEIVKVLAVNLDAKTITSVLLENDVYTMVIQSSLMTGMQLNSISIKEVKAVIPGNSSNFLILYNDGSFDLWDSDSFQLINHFPGYTELRNLKDRSLENPEGYDYSGIWPCSVDDAVIAVNSDLIITYELSEGLRIWDVRTHNYLGEIPLNYQLDGYIFSIKISFSPDGRLIAVVGDDGIIRLWGVKAESGVGNE